MMKALGYPGCTGQEPGCQAVRLPRGQPAKHPRSRVAKQTGDKPGSSADPRQKVQKALDVALDGCAASAWERASQHQWELGEVGVSGGQR